MNSAVVKLVASNSPVISFNFCQTILSKFEKFVAVIVTFEEPSFLIQDPNDSNSIFKSNVGGLANPE